MIEITHYLEGPKLWELWYIPYYGSCSIYIINRKASTALLQVTIRVTTRKKGL